MKIKMFVNMDDNKSSVVFSHYKSGTRMYIFHQLIFPPYNQGIYRSYYMRLNSKRLEKLV